MSIIVWDKKGVASDRQVTCGQTITTLGHKKIEKYNDIVLAFVGTSKFQNCLFKWAKEGEKLDDFPKNIPDDGHAILVVFTKKEIREYYSSAYFLSLSIKEFYATGSGYEVAIGALHAGADAKKAAKIACQLNVYCGGQIDYIEL